MAASHALIIPALAAVLLGAPLTAQAAQADDAALLHMTTVTLQATGEVKAEPDQARLTFGVQTQGARATDAVDQNRSKMASSLAALRAAGIEGRDVQTSSLELNGQYAYAPDQAPRLTGYQATNQVTIVVHDLARLGRVIDAVTAAGINQINGITFGLADPTPIENEARRRAVKLLTSRAELYAEASGMKLGRLITLTEAGGYPPPVVRKTFQAAAMRVAAAPTPVEPGELSVQIEVSATFELVR
jgi:uncharacterized protein YggE